MSLLRVLQHTCDCPADIIQAPSLLVVSRFTPHIKTPPSTSSLQRRHNIVQQLARLTHDACLRHSSEGEFHHRYWRVQDFNKPDTSPSHFTTPNKRKKVN